jgi:proteasome alpha subunit
MYDEPFRWVEAVRNRHDYLEDQLSTGSPIIGLPYRDGALLATLGTGTPKLYEIYDQIALGGMGHPADLEKLRNVVLDVAHVEGFNRSPADVTLGRLMKSIMTAYSKRTVALWS